MDLLQQIAVYFIALTAGGLCLVGGIFVVRHQHQQHADQMRQTWELFFPSTMGHNQVLSFIRSLSGLPKPKFMQPSYAVSFERYADEKGERYFLHTPGRIAARLDELFYEHIEGEMEPVMAEDDPIAHTMWTKATELAMGGGAAGLVKPLRIISAEGTARSMSAQFKNINAGEALVLQWVILPDSPRAPEGEQKEKVTDHTFHAIARLGAVGGRPDGMIYDLSSVFKHVEGSRAHFRRRLLPNVPERIRRRAGTLGFPIFLNATEFSALMGWPLNGSGTRRAKRIAPTIAHNQPGEGLITVGASNSPKLQHRLVAIPAKALMVHTWVLGPSGSGKSVLLENIAHGVLTAGMGLFVIEPKRDLAWAILNAIPESRKDEVVWFDPTDKNMPIGLNILSGNDPSRITGHVISMFRTLSGDAWGHQLQRVLRNAVYTAVLNDLTLYDVRQLLVNKEYRQSQVRKINRSKYPDVVQEWRWLDEKADLTVDSAVTRLDTFLGDPVIRNIVSQHGGLDIDSIVRGQKILLCPLPSANLGQSNASAVGQLVWEMLWDASLRRPPAERTNLNILMADEYQSYATASLSSSDPFAEARSYGLGLVVANQFTDQLPTAVHNSVSKNVQNVMAFSMAPEEAKKVRDLFAPLTAEDLSNLPRYGVAARVMSSGGRAPTVTLKTAPPPRPTGTAHYIIERSRRLYGRPVAEVEAELMTRHKFGEPKRRPTIGEISE